MTSRKKMSKKSSTTSKTSTTSTLFPDGSSDSEEDNAKTPSASSTGFNHFQINNNYAQRYDTWRNKEETMKVKARYGVDNIEDIEISSESSSSEDEDWTPAKEKAFFKTLSSLKSKDPKIYDPGTKFFTQEEKEKAEREGQALTQPEGSDSSRKIKKKSKAKEKPFLLKDHERTMILEKGGLMSSDEEGEGGQRSSKLTNPDTMAVAPLSYYQELDSIKKGFSNALKEIDSDDDDPESEKLLKKRKPKSEEEERYEEEAYRLWLKGELGRLEKGGLSKGEEKELGFLRSYWNDDKLDEGEKFLRDYILNRKYIEPEEEDKEYIPRYNEIVHDSDEGGLSNDEQFENQREEFEHKYNFRFEEPDPEFIKRFPRTIQDSLRRENERRKRQRESTRDRKKEVKDRKVEEVQRLKAMKRKEIMDKLQQLQEISGDPDLPLEDVDLDGDFDPEEYDRRMKKVFNDKYYDEDGTEDKKPEFPFDPQIDDELNWNQWAASGDEDDTNEENKPSLSNTKSTNDNETIVKIEPIEETSQSERSRQKAARRKQKSIDELIESSKGRKANQNKSAFMEVLEKKKPKFDPKVHKSFEKYFREYYALDFEDLIGDLPCRFKYRKVTPNDFGLSTTEILKGEDKELNQWASLKKTYLYREDEEEKYEAHAYQKKAENEKLKKRSLPSIYDTNRRENESDEEDEVRTPFNTFKSPRVQNDEAKNGNESIEPEIEKKKSKRKKKNKKKKKTQTLTEAQDDPSEQVNEIPTKSSQNVSLAKKDSEGKEKTEKKSKKNKSKKAQKLDTSTSHSPQVSNQTNGNNKKKGLKRKMDVDVGIEDDRLKAYGLNPTKYKKWVKYGGVTKS